MENLSYVAFRLEFPEEDIFTAGKEASDEHKQKALTARRKLSGLLKSHGDEAAKLAVLEKAINVAGRPISKRPDAFVSTFTRASVSGDSLFVWCWYYYLHLNDIDRSTLDEIDALFLPDGKTFEQAAGRPVRAGSVANPELAKSAWKIEEEHVRNFLEPVLGEQSVRQLIGIMEDVVHGNLQVKPISYKSSIVEQAQNEGIIPVEDGARWLTVALQCGLVPDTDAGFTGEEPGIFEETHKERWRFLDDPEIGRGSEWLERIAENSENKDYLEREYQSTGHFSVERQKRSEFLKCLISTQESQPLVYRSKSTIGLLNKFAEMSVSERTRDFIDYSVARNAAVTDQSELEIQKYYRLRDRPFNEKRMIDIRYHMINASYALRQFDHYGTKEVSTKLRLSPEHDPAKQDKLNQELLGGFDAEKEIQEFCDDFEVDVEN